MKRSIASALLFSGLLLPAVGFAESDDSAYREACIRSMQLTAEDIETGLHEYRILRCIDERSNRALDLQYIRRAAERQERMLSEFRGRIREGRRFLSSDNQQRFQTERDADDLRARAFTRRTLLRSIDSVTNEDARAERSKLLQERMTTARTTCKNVPRSFYQNCVRETIRSLGRATDFSTIPSTRKY